MLFNRWFYLQDKTVDVELPVSITEFRKCLKYLKTGLDDNDSERVYKRFAHGAKDGATSSQQPSSDTSQQPSTKENTDALLVFQNFLEILNYTKEQAEVSFSYRHVMTVFIYILTTSIPLELFFPIGGQFIRNFSKY